MEINIRPIAPGDNKAIAQIIRNTLTEFKANHPGTVYYDASTDHLYELFQTPGSAYWVAEKNEELLGGVGIFPTEGLPTGTAELVKMYLLPVARGKGLGRQLINHSLDWARSAGYQQIYLESMPELRQALKVYEKFGFQYLPAALGNSGHSGCSLWMLKQL
ncbi:MAG: GNAT family N-acetyltransferase [Chitinophagaceae bacterium]